MMTNNSAWPTVVAGFVVGASVDARRDSCEPGVQEPWIAGYRVRAVEFEDVVVEREGIAFCVHMSQVRLPA